MTILHGIKKYILSLVVLLLIHISADGSEHAISIYYPPDRSVTEYGLLAIVLSLSDGSADTLSVSIKDKITAIPVNNAQKYQCFSVRTLPGINMIDITALKDNTIIDTVHITSFHRSGLMDKYMNPPEGYKKDHFHMKEHHECTLCHTLKASDADRKPLNQHNITRGAAGGEPDGTRSTCSSCHKSMTASPYVHGPVSVWNCLSCHSPDANPIYSVMEPDAEECFLCHVEQKREWTAKKYIHGPVTLGKCIICHRPHESDYPFSLYMPVWNLCITCHADNATGKHVLADEFSSEGHPTHNRMDPLRPGKELTCASCHAAHASNSPNLWVFDVQDIFHLCLKCHKE